MRTQTAEHPRSNGGDKAQDCRRLAMKAGKRAAQASDADIRTTFLSMKDCGSISRTRSIAASAAHKTREPTSGNG